MTRWAQHSEDGSVSLFVVVLAVALLAAIGLVVDGGGKIRALQRADEAAREAARAGSQMLDVPRAVRGQRVTLDPASAARAARAHLDAAGIQGTVTVSGGEVTVTTRARYQPVFLALAGFGPMTVTGSASAGPVKGDEEVRR
ncbi:MAG TPA: pilus assembly protein TadG-related protein [Kineosporiaceae bacterium]|nr:pilus assembly protein TadG-related protein [Kineosporiaceae bacterium]